MKHKLCTKIIKYKWNKLSYNLCQNLEIQKLLNKKENKLSYNLYQTLET